MMTTKKSKNEAEVLFQKLGNTWYVFSEIEENIVYSALPEGIDPKTTRLELFEVIENHLKKVSRSMNTKNKRPADIAA